MSHTNHCPHCHHDSLRRPPRAALLLVALAWGFVVVLLFASALIGPFIMFLVPAILAFGAAAVRSAHDVAFAPPACERCGKVVLAEAPVAAVGPVVAAADLRAA